MYKECRTYANTGDAWAEPFLQEEVRWLQPLRARALRFDPRWRAISRNLPRGARVLDAGCGISAWPMFLRQQGYDVVGVYFSERMIELLRRRSPQLEWLVGAVQSIPTPDASFDGVISWGVIEHDEYGPETALAEFHRVLQPGGRVILTVPVDSKRQRRASQLHFAGNGASTFFQYFMSPKEFTAHAAAAGFQVREPVVPVSSHYSLLFPRLYYRFCKYPPTLGRAVGWALRPITHLHPGATNMIMLVAEKPR
jgi:SAM-dependent methyltransferase